MLSRFDFNKLKTDHLVIWFGAGADFFQQLKLDFILDKVKAYIFGNHKKSFLQLLPLEVFQRNYIHL